MGQRRLSQLARTLLSREAESKYPPPKNKHTQKFHTHTPHTQTGVKKMEKKLGVFFTTIVTHINNNATTLSISSLTLTQTSKQPLSFPSLSLSTIRALLCIYLFHRPIISLALNYNSRSSSPLFVSPPYLVSACFSMETK